MEFSKVVVIPGAMMNSETSWYFYLFSPDGRVYAGCPPNGELDHFDFSAAAVKEPRLTGYYRVQGSRVEFVWAGARKPERSEFRSGTTAKHTVFPYGKGAIFVDGAFYISPR